MKCNRCWADVEPKSQSIATLCGHFFCMKCAQHIIESDSACPVCENMVTKSNVKVVTALQEPAACKLNLCAQPPDTALNSALASVNFYSKQMELYYEYREAQLKKKLQKVQEQCRQKLVEVHNGYQQAKQKYREAMQDNQELQQKYSQKSMQARKLQEMVKRLQAENHQQKVTGSFHSTHSGDIMSPTMGAQIQRQQQQQQQQQQQYRQVPVHQTHMFGGDMGTEQLFRNGQNHSSQQFTRPSGTQQQRRKSMAHQSGRFTRAQHSNRKSQRFNTPNSPTSLRHLLGTSAGSVVSGGSGAPGPFTPGSPSGMMSF